MPPSAPPPPRPQVAAAAPPLHPPSQPRQQALQRAQQRAPPSCKTHVVSLGRGEEREGAAMGRSRARATCMAAAVAAVSSPALDAGRSGVASQRVGACRRHSLGWRRRRLGQDGLAEAPHSALPLLHVRGKQYGVVVLRERAQQRRGKRSRQAGEQGHVHSASMARRAGNKMGR